MGSVEDAKEAVRLFDGSVSLAVLLSFTSKISFLVCLLHQFIKHLIHLQYEKMQNIER